MTVARTLLIQNVVIEILGCFLSVQYLTCFLDISSYQNKDGKLYECCGMTIESGDLTF